MRADVAGIRPQPSIELAPFHQWAFPDGSIWTQFFRRGSGYLLRFPGLADFEVTSDGLTVHCWPVPDVADETIEHLLNNQVTPLALSRQGRLVFHASAVVLDGGAVAFVGESGRGKSTLAASLAPSGCPILTDDGLEVEEHAGRFQVRPGHSSIRLWSDSQEAVLGPGASLAPALEYTTKSRIVAADRLAFCTEPRELRRVYFLENGTAQTPTIERISAADALIELVRHSFVLDIEARALITSHFDQVSRLVAGVTLRRLDYPRRFDVLDEVRHAVRDDCHTSARPG